MHVTSPEHHHWRLLEWIQRLKQIVCLPVQCVCVYVHVHMYMYMYMYVYVYVYVNSDLFSGLLAM